MAGPIRFRDFAHNDADTSNRGHGDHCIWKWRGGWDSRKMETLRQESIVDSLRGGGGGSGSQGENDQADMRDRGEVEDDTGEGSVVGKST